MEIILGLVVLAAVGYFVFRPKASAVNSQITDAVTQAPYKVEAPEPAPVVEEVKEQPAPVAEKKRKPAAIKAAPKAKKPAAKKATGQKPRGRKPKAQ